MSAAWLLLFFLPFLLSLLGKAPMPRVLCLVCSAMAMLLSVQPGGAVLPWGLGMVIAIISVREDVRRIKTRRDCSRRAPTFATRWSRAENAPMPSLEKNAQRAIPAR
jgi:hypothetical protein